MSGLLGAIREHLIIKISIPIAAILIVCIFAWSYYRIGNEEQSAMNTLMTSADRVCNTVRLGLHYSMMLNSREDIQAIIGNYSRLREVRGIRLLNKQGQVMFSDREGDAAMRIGRDKPLCQVCHDEAEPPLNPPLADRVYSDGLQDSEHTLRMISPIPNEAGCSAASSCHFHRPEEKILGILDLAFSLNDSDSLVLGIKQNTIHLAAALFLSTFSSLFILVLVLIKRPISRIIGQIAVLSRGHKPARAAVDQEDEVGQLGRAIHRMGCELIDQQNQLILQKNLYQDLFEGVPCLVTVQDRNLRLLRFNRTFAEKFSAKVGDFCYKAYKNLDSPCPSCPVEKTFKTGQAHSTEESGCYKDGTPAHWIVTTAPVMDSEGKVVAAMEMCLDITARKDLEGELKRSEKKYCDIFNNVPSAILVLDQEDFSILDCNRVAVTLYGRTKSELAAMSFMEFFVDDDRSAYIAQMRSCAVINQTRHVRADGREFFVSISTSPSEAAGRRVLLATVSDITPRLEAEQQLIQASKMATLGEMATGVAHELNQPLSVIQTSLDLIRRSLDREEVPDRPVLQRIVDLGVAHIERATKIIGHMREFGRKAEPDLETVDLNAVLARATEFFSQQLALRGIELTWELDDRLPQVRCEPNRMEQVFINIMINARDAIEERAARTDGGVERRITIKTMHNRDYATVRISDTGTGVPAAIADRIYEPFFTTKAAGKGTGLGLSISYGIVKEYGGAINVACNESGGASFFVRLPVAEAG